MSDFNKKITRTTLYLRNMVLKQLHCVIEILEEHPDGSFSLHYSLNERLENSFWQISVSNDRVLIRIPEIFAMKDTAWVSKDFPLPQTEVIQVDRLDSIPKSYLNILVQDAYMKAHRNEINPTFGYLFKVIPRKLLPRKAVDNKI